MDNPSIREVKGLVSENQVTLMFLPGKSYNKLLLEIVESIYKDYEIVVYIAMNRSASKIMKELDAKGCDMDKFFFIDVISKDVRLSKPTKNCSFVPTKDITALSIEIGMSLSKNKRGLLLIDSIHTMQSHETSSIISRFAHDLITRLDTSDWKGLLPTTSTEKSNPLTSDLEMFVDEVIELS